MAHEAIKKKWFRASRTSYSPRIAYQREDGGIEAIGGFWGEGGEEYNKHAIEVHNGLLGLLRDNAPALERYRDGDFITGEEISSLLNKLLDLYLKLDLVEEADDTV